MFSRITQIKSELVAQRYAWMRAGIVGAKEFLASGSVPDFKQHEHSGCDCKPDSVFWKVYAYDAYVVKHG